MNQEQPRDRVNSILYAGFILCVIGCAIGGLRNNELVTTIPVCVMAAIGVIYVARRHIIRRKRARMSQDSTT